MLALLAAAPAVSQPAGSYEVELIIFRRSPEARNSVEDSALPATAWPRGAAIIGAGDRVWTAACGPHRRSHKQRFLVG